MFDQLVVSNRQRRKHTTAKFFVGTSALYISAVACAFLVSIVVSDPKLADTEYIVVLPPLPLRAAAPPPSTTVVQPARPTTARPDLNNLRNLDDILRNRHSGPPRIPQTADFRDTNALAIGPSSAPAGFVPGNGGVRGGSDIGEPPPTPDPPKPKPAAPAPVVDNRPLRVPSTVLQGKAIERRLPTYPYLLKQMKREDTVSVEVIISPEGVVESARAVSGHPLSRKAAEDAARGWRFEPTLLNNVPVRVTGVITFVFKLNE